MGKMNEISIEITRNVDAAADALTMALQSLMQARNDFQVLGDSREQEVDELVEEIAKAEIHVRKILDSLQPQEDNEHSNVWISPPSQEVLADLYAHPRDCRCPNCNGDGGPAPDFDTRWTEGREYDADDNPMTPSEFSYSQTGDPSGLYSE